MSGLAERWLASLPSYADPIAADQVGADLVARWSEPHRTYHAVDHLTAVLSIVDSNAALADDVDAVRLAAWFHDAVYNPRAADNEERSALLAQRRLAALGVPPREVAETVRLIRLTATHEVPDHDGNAAVLADADLAILAAAPADYDRYAAAVRREYAHVPDEAFRTGRAAVLGHLLALPCLYRIVMERAEWTERARANLTRELRLLKHGL